MIQRVEKQRQVTHNPAMVREVAAISNRVVNNLEEFESGTNALFANNRRRDSNSNARSSLFCDYCR